MGVRLMPSWEAISALERFSRWNNRWTSAHSYTLSTPSFSVSFLNRSSVETDWFYGNVFSFRLAEGAAPWKAS